MAMTGAALASAIESAMGINPATDPTGIGHANLLLMCNAIVTYIQSNALVSFALVSTVVAPPSGGPCIGTLTAGTIT